MSTYTIDSRTDYSVDGKPYQVKWIECQICGLKSFHPQDIEYRYCVRCDVFHEHPADQQAIRDRIKQHHDPARKQFKSDETQD